MKLRSAIISAVCGLTLIAGAAVAAPQIQGRQLSVDASDLNHYLSAGFPQRHEALGGLLTLTISQPQVALPSGDRLDLSFDLALASGGSSATPLGRIALNSGLRYDNAQQGIFLDQPAIQRFTPAHGSGELDATSRELLNSWLRDYARKQPVYRLQSDITQRMGDLQVQSVAVHNERLVVNFNQDIGAVLPAAALPQP